MEEDRRSFDELIISLLKDDNPRAMDLLYSQYASALQQQTERLLNDPAQAEDIVQDLLLTVWEKRHQLHLKYPLQSYLLKAAYNRCISHMRQYRPRKSSSYGSEGYSAGIEAEADVKANTADLSARIKATKARLPHRTKMAFILSRSFKMSYKEIAAFMGISEKGVEKHLRKAKRSFERMVKRFLKVWPVVFLMYDKLKEWFF